MPPSSAGTSSPVQPRSTRVLHNAGVMPVGSSANWRSRSGPHSRSSALRATSWRASCSSSYVKSTASPDVAPFPDTRRQSTRWSATLRRWTSPWRPRTRSSATSCGPGWTRTCRRSSKPSRSGTMQASPARRASRRRQKWQRKLHEGGWAAIHWGPEYANGRTINAMQRLIYSEVMAEYRTPGMFNTNGIWQIGPMIIAWGTEEQKARWLPSILEAAEHWCQGFSEPDGGQRPGQPADRRPSRTPTPTSTWSTARRSGSRPPTWPRGGCSCCGRTPPPSSGGRSTRASPPSSSTCRPRGSRCGPSATWPARRCSTRSSSPTCVIPARRPPRRRGRGVDGGHGHPRLRAGGHRRADRHPGRRPARHGRRGPVGQPRRARGPVPAGPHRPGVDRDRAGPPAVPAGAEQDHQGREELARGSLRQALSGRRWPRRWPRWPSTCSARPACWPGAAPTPSTGASGPASTPSSVTAPSAGARPRCRRTSSPTGRSSCPARPAYLLTCPPTPAAPCIIGVARRTWHASEPAPEPLDMWETVARAAAARRRVPGALAGSRASRSSTASRGSTTIPAPGWPSGWAPIRLGARYSGLGGSVPLRLVSEAAAAMARGRAGPGPRRRGRGPGHRAAHPSSAVVAPPAEPRPFPLTIDRPESGQRHLPGLSDLRPPRHRPPGPSRPLAVDEHRAHLGRLLAPMTEVAAASPSTPGSRWPGAPTRSPTPTAEPDGGHALHQAHDGHHGRGHGGRGAGGHAERGRRAGRARRQRVYLRGAGCRGPSTMAARPEPWRSPAMAAAMARSPRAGSHRRRGPSRPLLLLRQLASFARDALGIAGDDRA